jgi:hypothetical protein
MWRVPHACCQGWEPPWTALHDARRVSARHGLSSAKNVVVTLPWPGSGAAGLATASRRGRCGRPETRSLCCPLLRGRFAPERAPCRSQRSAASTSAATLGIRSVPATFGHRGLSARWLQSSESSPSRGLPRTARRNYVDIANASSPRISPQDQEAGLSRPSFSPGPVSASPGVSRRARRRGWRTAAPGRSGRAR